MFSKKIRSKTSANCLFSIINVLETDPEKFIFNCCIFSPSGEQTIKFAFLLMATDSVLVFPITKQFSYEYPYTGAYAGYIIRCRIAVFPNLF